ncbi:MAG: hydrogenase expression/formation protein HypE [Actinomycetota bacterium]
MSDDRILLAHGSGGKVSHRLITEFFLKTFDDPALKKQDDAAVITGAGRLAFTTDSYVVKPVFFPGGDIGKLAVCGTVNDLAMSGAAPKYVSAGFIIEEGFPFTDLKKIIESMAKAAREAGVAIVTGDTKVVEKGSADEIYINTAGIGLIGEGVEISGGNIRPGDILILSGSLGDHGMAVMSRREGLTFGTEVVSDCAPLNGLVSEVLASGATVRALRDPTRGGLAGTLNEFADQSGVTITIDETSVPIKEQVLGACEMLGLDPFQVANEGKAVAVVAPADSAKALAVMRRSPYGREAAVIGEASVGKPRVLMRTMIGTTRILDMLIGEQLPRIC